MATIRLNTTGITDALSFHQACKDLMGFPDDYGMNWSAWIDCLTFLNDSGGQRSNFHLGPGEHLIIEITDIENFQLRLPSLLSSLLACSADVNQRHQEAGLANRIALVFIHDSHEPHTER